MSEGLFLSLSLSSLFQLAAIPLHFPYLHPSCLRFSRFVLVLRGFLRSLPFRPPVVSTATDSERRKSPRANQKRQLAHRVPREQSESRLRRNHRAPSFANHPRCSLLLRERVGTVSNSPFFLYFSFFFFLKRKITRRTDDQNLNKSRDYLK